MKPSPYKSSYFKYSLIIFLFCILLLGCAKQPIVVDSTGKTLALLEPVLGTYFGVNLDWENETPSEFNSSLGHRAAVYVKFCSFPLTEADEKYLDAALDLVSEEGGKMMITLEPWGGLQMVTPDSASVFAEKLNAYDQIDVGVFVRFAHEMNGSWYPWGQQPTEYINAFRMIADAVHEKAPKSAMLWAPNYGGGYPFSGGEFEIKPEDPDFVLVDSNKDGLLDMGDDPYGPYYPGDDAVDWVGISLYHWGNTYPWGKNETPEDGKFIAQLTGTYKGLNGDETSVPDFYNDYYLGHNKPVAIPETAAFYVQERGGPGELEIKQAWWRQVLDPDMLAQFPGIKMINWFEWQKPESEVGGDIVDWRVFTSQPTADQFLKDLPLDMLVFAQ